MEIVFISDTHSYHDQLVLPKGDMIIHAGDLSKRGSEHEIAAFIAWFEKLDFKYKIFIAGNHDFYFERAPASSIEKIVPDSIHYLNDSGVEIEGIKIWGSPVQPAFFDWAFNRVRGEDIKKHWDLIPKDTDILVTHGPPYGILDKTIRGENVGCEELSNFLKTAPIKINVYGHIHEAYGMRVVNHTKFINASVVNLNYQVVNPPIKVSWE